MVGRTDELGPANADVRACEICGAIENVARRWIAEHDQSGSLTNWIEGLLCADCGASREQPPDIIGDPESLAPLEPSLAAGTPLPEPAVRLGFKALTLENWQHPDPVLAAWAGFSPMDGQFRNSLTGEDWAYHILAIPLAAVVPDELRRLFEVARGTMLYGWFFYPAFTLASEQFLRVAEAAVAYRCQELGAPRSIRTLERKLAWLNDLGHLSKDDLERWDAVRHLRNLASHPADQNILWPGLVISQTRLLAGLVGALFQQGG